MPKVDLIRHIAHPAEELVDMVADVENYPLFIKLSSALRVTKRFSPDDFEAEAIVRYKLLRESFKSRIRVDRAARSIHVGKAGQGGALKTLDNFWEFHPLSDGSTLIEFKVEVSLKAFPLNILVQDKIQKATHVILGAFERRAAQICTPVNSEGLDLEAEKLRLGLV